jgi:hypothetical protein
MYSMRLLRRTLGSSGVGSRIGFGVMWEPIELESVAAVDRREFLHLRIEVPRRVAAPSQQLVERDAGFHQQRTGRVHVARPRDLGQVVLADEDLGARDVTEPRGQPEVIGMRVRDDDARDLLQDETVLGEPEAKGVLRGPRVGAAVDQRDRALGEHVDVRRPHLERRGNDHTKEEVRARGHGADAIG